MGPTSVILLPSSTSLPTVSSWSQPFFAWMYFSERLQNGPNISFEIHFRMQDDYESLQANKTGQQPQRPHLFSSTKASGNKQKKKMQEHTCNTHKNLWTVPKTSFTKSPSRAVGTMWVNPAAAPRYYKAYNSWQQIAAPQLDHNGTEVAAAPHRAPWLAGDFCAAGWGQRIPGSPTSTALPAVRPTPQHPLGTSSRRTYPHTQQVGNLGATSLLQTLAFSLNEPFIAFALQRNCSG